MHRSDRPPLSRSARLSRLGPLGCLLFALTGLARPAWGQFPVTGNAVNFQGATVNLTPTANLGLTNFTPSAVAADNAGNTYIADQANQQIYEVGTDGTWNLLALNNLPAPALGRPTGLAVDGAGDLFIADPDNNRVIWVDPSDDTAYVLASYTTGTGPAFAPGLWPLVPVMAACIALIRLRRRFGISAIHSPDSYLTIRTPAMREEDLLSPIIS